MRITVILPHDQQRTSPGVRIRYERIVPHLKRLGHRLELKLIDELRTTEAARSDIYLFCKCYDIRSILLAEYFTAQGKQVGVDVFDDYFSQIDNRLTHLRSWMHRVSRHIAFFLCATEPMRARLSEIAPHIAAHVLNDPFDEFDLIALRSSTKSRAELARRSKSVEIAWFGTGDNPYFPVGLDDLCAYGDTLAGFRRYGLAPRLRVLTNTRAMTPQRLERLARLPVPTELEEWTLERETALLRTSFVTFLPVNAQPFSTVKSLNRAVTALANGTQVLSAGYPLYRELDPFIYRDVADVAVDLMRDRLRLREQALPSLAAWFARLADPRNETKRLIEFLSGLSEPSITALDRSASPPIVVLHGSGNAAPQHKFVQRSKMYSAAAPFQDAQMNYDLRLVIEESGQLSVVLSERTLKLLHERLHNSLQPYPTSSPIKYKKLPLEDTCQLGLSAVRLTEKLAIYETVMYASIALIKRILPGVRVIVSETAAPFCLPHANWEPTDV
ncbi:hypothetical protein ABGN05_29340 [Aquibium sp. LZ166]|uniref:Glycosyltransferase family 1 protein n=1 Tax=Aquibium pacificus TaxID=3153579 RepID=A0ABV3SSS8_9HYPH